ncbi:hypothetical protein, partial [Enterobacter kobei]|uniref:hypothetical protein n=1 Tax=Enterobacter kobei TaxID=208224 RepID=UPI00296E6577
SSFAAKGKGATGMNVKQGRAQRVHFTLVFRADTVLRKALREGTTRVMGIGERQNAHTTTRRNGVASSERHRRGER